MLFITFTEDTPAPKRPPIGNTLMIILNIALAFNTLGRPDFVQILDRFAFIPARHLSYTLVTGLFLHSSWAQLVANLTFLYMFGRGVEREWGTGRYFLSYLACGIAGEFTHRYFHPDGVLAFVGASRVVTGMGIVYLLHYPWGRMKWYITFFGAPVVEFPSRTIYTMVLWVGIQAAMAFVPWYRLSEWFPALNHIWGPLLTIHPTAGTAWIAHLGAALTGLILFLYFFLGGAGKKKAR
jgi:membrane associated rhomboid family serine protease